VEGRGESHLTFTSLELLTTERGSLVGDLRGSEIVREFFERHGR
jgi:hypothetical protein